MSEPATPSLAIASVVGGPTTLNRGWSAGMRELNRKVVQARAGVQSSIKVNVEFHIPGSVLAVDFDHPRTGAFRRADKLLKVQIPLPEEAPQAPAAALLQEIYRALNVVDEWIDRKRLNCDTSELRNMLDMIVL